MADGMTLTHRPLPSFCHAPITHTKYMRAAGVPLWSFCCGFASDRSVLSSTWTKHESNEPEWTTITRRSLVDVVQPSNLKVFCVLSLCIYFSSDVIKESANLAFIWSAVCRTKQIAQARTWMYCITIESRRARHLVRENISRRQEVIRIVHIHTRSDAVYDSFMSRNANVRVNTAGTMKSHCSPTERKASTEKLYEKPVSWRKTQPAKQSYG